MGDVRMLTIFLEGVGSPTKSGKSFCQRLSQELLLLPVFDDWWMQGLGNPTSFLLFGVVAWVLWKRRNHLVFQNEAWSVKEVCSQVKLWDHLSSSRWKALQVSREVLGLARQAYLIGWRPAEEAFSSNLGTCSIMRADLRGIVEGMQLVWNKGTRKLRVQSDSKAAMDMFSISKSGCSTHAALVE
ncbi:hypothetical protein LINPERHAP2_LOCUS28790 [Linum perenne]